MSYRFVATAAFFAALVGVCVGCGPSGRVQEQTIEVKPQAGQAIRLRANLIDYDPLGDDSSGDETVLAPFETGWRRDVSFVLTGSGSRVRVTYQLAPI